MYCVFFYCYAEMFGKHEDKTGKEKVLGDGEVKYLLSLSKW